MIEKLKQRWHLHTTWDVIAVLIVFSLAGSTSLYVKKPIFDLFDISKETMPTLNYVLSYIIVFMPAYQMLFLFWGFVFRQWKFVWYFEKKIFKRMLYLEIAAVSTYIVVYYVS